MFSPAAASAGEIIEIGPTSACQSGGRRVLFVSGDDIEAKSDVSSILQKIGFATIDLGGLATGGRLQQFPGGPLPALNLVKLG